jgi:hypothetical protein
MLTEKDYCDYDTCVALKELGYKVPTSAYYMPNNETLYFVSNPYRGGYVIDCFFSHNSLREDVMTYDFIDAPTMWEAQKWLREEKGIHIAPRIYLYHDINLDEHTSWECTIYVEWSSIYTIGKSLTYEEALLLGIKEAVKILKEK